MRVKLQLLVTIYYYFPVPVVIKRLGSVTAHGRGVHCEYCPPRAKDITANICLPYWFHRLISAYIKDYNFQRQDVMVTWVSYCPHVLLYSVFYAYFVVRLRFRCMQFKSAQMLVIWHPAWQSDRYSCDNRQKKFMLCQFHDSWRFRLTTAPLLTYSYKVWGNALPILEAVAVKEDRGSVAKPLSCMPWFN